MNSPSHDTGGRTPRHSCQLFDSRDSVATSVGAFFRDGLEAGDNVLAVMCPEHWTSTDRYLRGQGVNPSAVLASGQLTVLDAATTLATFRRGGQIDPQLFDTSIGDLVRTLATGGRRLRVYGEMVDVLAMEGDFKASLQLEALWNELMASVSFDLFCGYSAVNFGNPRAADALRLICAAHTHLRANPRDLLATFLLRSGRRAEAVASSAAVLRVDEAIRHIVMYVPLSTYRLQLHAGFTLDDAADLAPYLAGLGADTCYTSPYFTANPGSMHGYDVCDHNAINPGARRPRGTRPLRRPALRPRPGSHGRLRAESHGCRHRHERLVARRPRERSRVAGRRYFDVDWDPVKAALRAKLLLPILGDQYGRVLERGELRLAFADGLLVVKYFELCAADQSPARAAGLSARDRTAHRRTRRRQRATARVPEYPDLAAEPARAERAGSRPPATTPPRSP